MTPAGRQAGLLAPPPPHKRTNGRTRSCGQGRTEGADAVRRQGRPGEWLHADWSAFRWVPALCPLASLPPPLPSQGLLTSLGQPRSSDPSFVSSSPLFPSCPHPGLLTTKRSTMWELASIVSVSLAILPIVRGCAFWEKKLVVQGPGWEVRELAPGQGL